MIVDHGPIPTRLAAKESHPWFHPYWSQRVHVFFDGHKFEGVTLADREAGYAIFYAKPLRRNDDGSLATLRFYGEVTFEPIEKDFR